MKTWGDIFRACVRRGIDHGYAAFAADRYMEQGEKQMLVDIRPDDPVGAVDIYPHADTEQEAALQVRFTIIHGKIYYNGNEWTAEKIERERERMLELDAAFKVAQSVVEMERRGGLPPVG